MHAASPERSARLQRLLHCLRKHPRGLTTAALADLTGSVAVGTDCSELRHRGYHVTCTFVGKTPEGRRIHCYRLEPSKNPGGLGS
jgi:hypothetical protein